MTAQLLANELGVLLQESRKKSGELRSATEKSLAELKLVTSLPENEAMKELSSKLFFASPFILACESKSTKLTILGISCLQRLIVSKALAQARLKEVLEVFRDSVSLGHDIQLKILQALPPLLQNYATSIKGSLLEEALGICSSLQGTKLAVVNSTAAATLQQLIVSVFDKVVAEDDKSSEISTVESLPIENGTVSVRPAAADAYRIFQDLCLHTEGQKPKYVQFAQIPQTFGLELIESVLSNHSEIFLSHDEQAQIVRARIAPFIIRSLSNRTNFPIAVRVIRVFYVLLRRHLVILESECEVALGLLMHMLDPDSAPPWKRALCMEIVKGCFSEASLVRKFYSIYDARNDRRPVVKELTGILARLATEKPSVIGLGTQSSVPLNQAALKENSNEQLTLEAGGVAGIIGGAVGLGEAAAPPGLSAQWSSIRVPCIEQLDKTDPPATPDSYLYGLVLSCLNSFSEGLARFILPISAPQVEIKGSKKRRIKLHSQIFSDSDAASGTDTPQRAVSPLGGITRKSSSMKKVAYGVLNPLTLETHPLLTEIQQCAAMVEACWPALLALYSTYLYATIDSEYYHSLVRSLQKFTQVAGVLRLSTPRDTFLTTLGKAAVPSQVFSSHMVSSALQESSNIYNNAKGMRSNDTLNSPLASNNEKGLGSQPNTSTQETRTIFLNARNLVCLRALLNVGTALGPTMGGAWTIVLETLQQADFILQSTFRGSSRSSSSSSKHNDQKIGNEAQTLLANIGPELTAVEGTIQRLIESTRNYDNQAFLSFLDALSSLLNNDGLDSINLSENATKKSSLETTSPALPVSRIPGTGDRRLNSIGSRQKSTTNTSALDNTFVIVKLGELIQVNIARLVTNEPIDNGWNLISQNLIRSIVSKKLEPNIRLKASEILHSLVILSASTANGEQSDIVEVQERILSLLLLEIQGLDVVRYGSSETTNNKVRLVDGDIHKSALEALNTMLEQSGESLKAGWMSLFQIINSAFLHIPDGNVTKATGKSARLLKTSFGSLQLICTDFLALLPLDCVLVLLDTLYAFCTQIDDLNISLTTITYFWNISDFLQRQEPGDQIEHDFPSTEPELLEAVRNTETGTSMVLWLLLLLRLAEITRDERSEVRNGSIQTLFRIFDTYGNTLGPKAWNSCLTIVIFKMMRTSEKLVRELTLQAANRKKWDETIVLILKGTGTLYTNFLHMFQLQASFEATWSTYINYLQTLLIWRSFEVTRTVYKEFAKLLEKAILSEEITEASRREAWTIWVSQGRSLVVGIENSNQNGSQETLTAFIDAFRPMYKLMGTCANTSDIQQALAVFRDCMLFPELPAYFFDVETQSALQASILESLRAIDVTSSEWTSLVLKEAAFLSRLPYRSSIKGDAKIRRPTYVAVASAALTLMGNLTLKHASSDTFIFEDNAVNEVLGAICEPIQLKYEFRAGATTRRDPLWVQATRVALKILDDLVPLLDIIVLKEDVQIKIWSDIVTIASAIISANSDDEDYDIVLKDEAADILSFQHLRALIIPRLGAKFIPSDVIELYVQSVFQSSLLYRLVDDELDLDFKKAHPQTKMLFGSTTDLQLERRSRMSYACVDELFDLCEFRPEGEEWNALAQAAIPFLLLRVSIVLRRFTADQPLRGRTPQPRCQRRELVYLMAKFTKLQCADYSLQEEGAQANDNRKQHLMLMFPFISQAVKAAHGDFELLGLLSTALTEIGNIR